MARIRNNSTANTCVDVATNSNKQKANIPMSNMIDSFSFIGLHFL